MAKCNQLTPLPFKGLNYGVNMLINAVFPTMSFLLTYCRLLLWLLGTFLFCQWFPDIIFCCL